MLTFPRHLVSRDYQAGVFPILLQIIFKFALAKAGTLLPWNVWLSFIQVVSLFFGGSLETCHLDKINSLPQCKVDCRRLVPEASAAKSRKEGGLTASWVRGAKREVTGYSKERKGVREVGQERKQTT